MRLKCLFLAMCVAALMFSCNNAIDPIDQTEVPGGIKPSKGIPTYFSLNMPQKAATYAGEDGLAGIADERAITNAAVFVYKMDVGGNTDPENYAFITTSGTNVILKTTDGTKKVFVALNVGPTAATFFDAAGLPGLTLLPADEGAAYSGGGQSYQNLNRSIWSSGLTGAGWGTAVVPSTTTPNFVASANGLIKAFAGGTTTYANGRLALIGGTSYGTPTAGTFYLMSNWDNNRTDTIYTAPFSPSYRSTCVFDFDPDVPKSSLTGGSASTPHPNNNVVINVQRAVAKATMKISPSIALAAPNDYIYASDGNDGDKGRFTPWGAASSTAKGSFTAGNISKVSTVFQKYTNYSVSDDNYAYISALTQTTDLYNNFDNVRIYGAGQNWNTSASTVTAVKTNMAAGQGTPTAEPNSYGLAKDTIYLTENAQSYSSGYQDNSTFLVVGGTYQPRHYITYIQQAAVNTNPPILVYNGKYTSPTALPTPNPIPSALAIAGSIYGNDPIADASREYQTVPYAASPADADSLFYHNGMKLFFYGKENLYKYYAWVLKYDVTSPDGPGSSMSPQTDPDVIAAINNDVKSGALVRYFQGQCFYRVFIADTKATLQNERVLVRRNHVYDVNITKIIGPGIADPNKLINPNIPVLPADTYIEVTIEIEQWHRVYQEQEVKGE